MKKKTLRRALYSSGIVIGVAALAISSVTLLPELVRYIKMKRM